MLFLQFMLYSSSFVGTLIKNEIPEALMELYQLKIKQLSPDILKFRTKHEDNPFTLNCFVVPRSFLFVFHVGSRRLGSNNSRNSSYKEKTAGLARVSRLSFRFLWLWCQQSEISWSTSFVILSIASQVEDTLKTIFTNIIRCFRLWVWVGYFIYFEFTVAIFCLMFQ